jgi:methylated-DNA-[protein]-cysteine S-methyltransferase
MTVFILPTSIGDVAIAFNGDAVARLSLPGFDQTDPEYLPVSKKISKVQSALIDQLRRYFDGEPVEFDSELDLADKSVISRKVYAQLRRVKWGEKTTYGELAKDCGMAGSARAVGRIIGQNDIPIIIPCHRVIRKDGTLGGFSAPMGLVTKRQLLDIENRVLAG